MFNIPPLLAMCFSRSFSLANNYDIHSLSFICYDICFHFQDMVSPIALFYSRMDGILIPLAIQLYQTSSDTNPVSDI